MDMGPLNTISPKTNKMAHQLLETTGIPTKLMTCFSWKSCYCAWISAVLGSCL